MQKICARARVRVYVYIMYSKDPKYIEAVVHFSLINCYIL